MKSTVMCVTRGDDDDDKLCSHDKCDTNFFTLAANAKSKRTQSHNIPRQKLKLKINYELQLYSYESIECDINVPHLLDQLNIVSILYSTQLEHRTTKSTRWEILYVNSSETQ